MKFLLLFSILFGTRPGSKLEGPGPNLVGIIPHKLPIRRRGGMP